MKSGGMDMAGRQHANDKRRMYNSEEKELEGSMRAEEENVDEDFRA